MRHRLEEKSCFVFADLNRYVIPVMGFGGFRKYVIPTMDCAVAWDLCFLKPPNKVSAF